MGGRGEVPVACRPDGQQRVADDLRDVAAVGDDDVDDLAEVRVDRAGESFGPGRPSSEGCSGQPGEAGDIDDEECRRKALGMRLVVGVVRRRQVPQDSLRDVAREGFDTPPGLERHPSIRLRFLKHARVSGQGSTVHARTARPRRSRARWSASVTGTRSWSCRGSGRRRTARRSSRRRRTAPSG